ncbi:MAG: type II toxin-antitoxin system prevent-host-death family antitoxin [Acidobacteriota bacterium]
MKQHQVTATELKAKCLALLDDVNEHGDIITITKRGKPVATLQPVKKQAWKSLEGVLAGQLGELSDLPPEFNFADDWECVRAQDAVQARAAKRSKAS